MQQGSPSYTPGAAQLRASPSDHTCPLTLTTEHSSWRPRQAEPSHPAGSPQAICQHCCGHQTSGHCFPATVTGTEEDRLGSHLFWRYKFQGVTGLPLTQAEGGGTCPGPAGPVHLTSLLLEGGPAGRAGQAQLLRAGARLCTPCPPPPQSPGTQIGKGTPDSQLGTKDQPVR